MIQLDLSDHGPLYEQIKEKLKLLIITDVLKADDKIPSVRELAQQLTINPNTIQRAYRDLEAEGYIYSVRAKGSFVASANHAKSRVEENALKDELVSIVRQAKFLGVMSEEIIDTVNKIYEEDSND